MQSKYLKLSLRECCCKRKKKRLKSQNRVVENEKKGQQYLREGMKAKKERKKGSEKMKLRYSRKWLEIVNE